MREDYRTRVIGAIRQMPQTFWLLWVGTLVNRLGGFVVPFLALYLTSERDISVVEATAIISLFGAGSFIGRIIGGDISDRFGRRPVMLLSFFATPAIVLVVGIAHAIPVLAVSTFLLGFFTDMYRPAVSAAVADILPPALRVRAFSYIYWAINVGAAVAPALGGFLAHAGYLPLFVADAATTLAFGFIVLFSFRETLAASARRTRTARERRRAPVLHWDPFLLIFSALTFLFGIVYVQSFSTLPVAMGMDGIGPSGYGVAISVNGLFIVLFGILVGRRVEHGRRFRALAGANLLLGAGFGITVFAHALPIYVISIAVWTFGEIINAAVAPSVVSDLALPATQGLYQGTYGAAWGLAFFVGPIVGGWLLGGAGQEALWCACFAAGVVTAVGFLLLSRPMEGAIRRRTGP